MGMRAKQAAHDEVLDDEATRERGVGARDVVGVADEKGVVGANTGIAGAGGRVTENGESSADVYGATFDEAPWELKGKVGAACCLLGSEAAFLGYAHFELCPC